ncbi:MAG: hypothetical protein DBY45_06045 [Clostridiales bacterium]|nr:MAG: hypothetical protein DBY45_06045 [Clostridiales bacterium]
MIDASFFENYVNIVQLNIIIHKDRPALQRYNEIKRMLFEKRRDSLTYFSFTPHNPGQDLGFYKN